MTTITVNNEGDAPVAGETDLRQAVAEAANSDTIVFASAGSGTTTITLNAPLAITPDVDIEGFTSNAVVGTNIQGSLTIPKGSVVRMVGVSIDGGLAGTDATANGLPGKNGAQGMGGMDGEDAGQSGTPGSGGGAATGGSGASADADGEDGVLVPVMCLVNGTSVRRVPVESVTYWHVELDAHDILLAEGLPCESYLECGDRAFFDGVDDPLADPDLVLQGLGARCRPWRSTAPSSKPSGVASTPFSRRVLRPPARGRRRRRSAPDRAFCFDRPHRGAPAPTDR